MPLFFNFSKNLFFTLLLLIISTRAISAPFEVKVHDELIADYEHSAFEIETNLYQGPSFQNLKSNVFQTRVEYGYGITPKSEVGINIYLSNYNGINYVNGGKISHLFIPTHNEDGIWHYGVKNEINYIKDIDGIDTTFFEFTPILALQLKDWRFTVNPSIDVSLDRNNSVTFSPSAKIAHHLSQAVDFGIEYYADNLPMKGLFTPQPNTAYLVLDTKYGKSNFHFGIGKGLNSLSDNWVVKFTTSLNFN